MKRNFLFIFSLLFYPVVFAQQNRTTKLFSYLPAPGQFINVSQIGTPGAALKITTSSDDLVSLGSFGGSIVLGFTEPVVNQPGNPYGIDFTLFGNAFPGSSEPGVIWVMKDVNRNGLPDDTWYQIAGSEFLNPRTRFNYPLQWKRLPDGAAEWLAQDNTSGLLPKNEFHLQPYYPDASFFPDFPADSFTVRGTWLDIYPDIASGKTVLNPLAFGYADNRSWNRNNNLTSPDNPYTPDIQEGAGGDPVDISWAVDSLGRYVDLDQISFIRIVSASTLVTAQLGEVSPEVGFAVATKGTADPSWSGEMVVIHTHPTVIYAGDTLELSAHFYKNGRPDGKPVHFELADPASGTLVSGNKVTFVMGGKFTINAYADIMPSINTSSGITILTPDSILIPEMKSTLLTGETLDFFPLLTDQFDNEITGLTWNVVASDTSLFQITSLERGFKLTAIRPGTGSLRIWTSRFPGKIRTIPVSVMENTAPVRVYVSVKTSGKNILPSQWIEIKSKASFNFSLQDNPDKNEQGNKSLADAIVTVLNTAGAVCEMKENSLPGIGMYLYSVEKEGEFTYGWGGKTSPAAFARGWIVRKNGRNYLNGLEKVTIRNGDSIIVYHVDNLLKDWNLNIITVTPDSVERGGWIDVRAKQVKCSFSMLAGITESTSWPLAGQPVFVGNDLVEMTNSEGKATLKMAENPPVKVTVGTEAVMIYRKTPTYSEEINKAYPGFYPNPADDYLIIRGLEGNDFKYSISDRMGRCVLESSPENSGTIIPVRQLKPGFYVVVIQYGNNIFQGKFIKK